VKNLEDMSFGHRAMLTVAIVIIILILLAAFGYLTGRWDEADAAQPQPLLQSIPITKYEKRLLELDREAADNAYRQQIVHLFQTWMKDESGQPTRAVTGARQARTAYERVMNAIEARDHLLRDSPQ